MNLADTILARRYARALINLFLQDLTQTELTKLESLRKYLVHNKNRLFSLELFLTPVSSQAFFSALIEQFELAQFWHKLLELMYIKKKLYLLPEILDALQDEYNKRKNRVIFYIQSTYELNSSELASIEKFLANATGKEVILKTQINRKLICGLKIFNNNLGWEYSIRKQLLPFRSQQEKAWNI